ncbi:triose-phosphate isomerase [Candidatus Kaiserbacteria bacterium]|nr:triose-phosphate isomerase [Candidatus Kaiserbacteria bacterium]
MFIVANWKAYVESLAEAKKLAELAKRLAAKTRVSLVIAPPAPLLAFLAARNRSSIGFAAQDVSAETGGAETGEVLAQISASAGATYAIIGHSERRARGESDEVVARKLAHALAQGLIPILCVGEHERDAEGGYLTFVREQVSSALEPLEPKERSRVILAYEPVWAIGKTSADAIVPADLGEMVLYLRKLLAELLPGKSSARSQVLYGGSVEPSDIRALAGGTQVDGFLVGHASVEPSTFAALVKAVA